MDSFNKHTIHFSEINKEQHQKNQYYQQHEAFSHLFFFPLKDINEISRHSFRHYRGHRGNRLVCTALYKNTV